MTVKRSIVFSLVPVVLFISVKGVDLLHFRISQLEIVQFGILSNMLRVAGAGNDHHALLQIPMEDHLG